MSESIPEEYLDAVKARDTRFRMLAEAIAIETELRDSVVIRALMEAVLEDANQAMRDIATISPADVSQIAFQQVRIRTLVYIREVLDTIMRRGSIAEQDIKAEDRDE